MIRLSLLLLTALAAAIFTTGCKPEASAEKTEFKHKDNTVYARLPADPDKLNPVLSTSVYARAVNENMFQYLMSFDPQTLALTPQLVKSGPVVEELTEGPLAGGVAYTYEIREEAQWDNGTPVTAKDFEFTLKALFNPVVKAASIRAYLDFIGALSIDPANPKKFTVLANKKYILAEPVIGNLAVLPEYVYDPNGLLRSFPLDELAQPARAEELAKQDKALTQFAEAFNAPQYSREKGFISGSGPYAFEGWETGQQIVLTRKKDWWGDKVPGSPPALAAFPEKLVFMIIPDQTATLTALKDQQIDVCGQIDAKDFIGLRDNESMKGLANLHTPSSLTYYFVGLNNKNPKLSDKRVRRALAHLVNVPDLIDNLFYGLGERIVGPFHPAKPYYNKGLQPIDFDPAKARELLASAGWEDTNNNGIVDKEIGGQKVELELEYLISNASNFARNQALLFEDDARKAGVKVNIVPQEFTVLIDNAKKRNYEMYAGAWAQDPIVDDPKQLWHTESDTPDGGNRVSFNNQEADELIEKIRITLDEKERNKLYLRFQEIIYEEQPYIFLMAPLERIAISKRFTAKASVRRPGFFVNEFLLKSDK
ncbi:MAG: ABC transporter substrate-binding protein [Phaeodactylibacter sp.]|nr:ABC transporter substrate-binding protein [Phaeodactylibacter sp.]MCB9275677.1 ABC transporter substrate-binding protein [Lewinellaceae bacterium]